MATRKQLAARKIYDWAAQVDEWPGHKRQNPEQHAQLLLNNVMVIIDKRYGPDRTVSAQAGRTDLTQPYIDMAHRTMDKHFWNIDDKVRVHNWESTFTIIAITAKASGELLYTLEDQYGNMGIGAAEDDIYMDAEPLPLNLCPSCECEVFLGNDYLCWECRNTLE